MNALRDYWRLMTFRHSFVASFMLILLLSVAFTAAINLWSTIPVVKTLTNMASDRQRVELMATSRHKIVELYKARKAFVEDQIKQCKDLHGAIFIERCKVKLHSRDDNALSFIRATKCSSCENVQAREIQWDSESVVVVKDPNEWYQMALPFDSLKPLVDQLAERLSSDEHLQLVMENVKDTFVLTVSSATLGAVAVCVVFFVFLSRRVRIEFATLRNFIRMLARGDHVPVPEALTRGSELGVLALDVYSLKKDLLAAQVRLREADRMEVWQTMARKVAHEIKNPLTPISLVGDQMMLIAGKEIKDNVRDQLRECGRIISEETQSLNRMVVEFTKFARLPKPNIESVDLVQVLSDFVARNSRGESSGGQTHPKLSFKNSLAIHDRAKVMCLADASMLHQVFHNLVNNARLSAPERVVSVEFELSEIFEGEQRMLAIDVRDDGPGVPIAVRDRMFEAYVTTRSTGNSEKGMGLGLAICRQIALDHGGWLNLHETSSKGTTMRLVIAGFIRR